MGNGGLRRSSWCSRLWVHMATIEPLPREWRDSCTCQLILTEREIKLLAWFRSVSIQLLWFFFFTLLLAIFDAKSYSGELHPVGQVSSVRVWGCFLTDRRCNFSCCLPLPSLKFSFENHLLTTTHYFISNFICLPHSWNSVPCTTECPLGSSPKKQLLCALVYSIFIPCSSPLGICSFISGIW